LAFKVTVAVAATHPTHGFAMVTFGAEVKMVVVGESATLATVVGASTAMAAAPVPPPPVNVTAEAAVYFAVLVVNVTAATDPDTVAVAVAWVQPAVPSTQPVGGSMVTVGAEV
jgi:hypothetical protein